MTITGGSSLPKEDIDRMVREAEEHAAEDKKRREDAETRNQAESFAYSIEKLLKENEDKISAEVKNEVQEALDASKKALEGDDIEDIKAKNETLTTVSQKIGEALYAQEQAAAANGEQPTDAPAADNDEDVVDAEIVDEDENK